MGSVLYGGKGGEGGLGQDGSRAVPSAGEERSKTRRVRLPGSSSRELTLLLTSHSPVSVRLEDVQ